VAQSFGLSVNISNLPSEGRQLYLTLYGYVAGVRGLQHSATYTATSTYRVRLQSPPMPVCPGYAISAYTLCLATIQNAPGAVHTQEFPDIRT